MSGDDLRVTTADLGELAAISDDLCHKLSDAAKRSHRRDDAMSGVLRTQMQTRQI
jgi:hypothetical protein